MKIAIICHASSGGSGIVGTELGLALAKRGHQVHFIASEIPFRLIGSWKKNVYYHEVEIFDYPLFKHPPYDLSLANKIYDVIMQNKIDIIHSHYAVPHATAAFLAKEMAKLAGRSVALITTLHGTDVSLIGKDPTLKDVVAFSLKKSDANTSVSRMMAEEAQNVYSLPETPEVIYNFIDVKPPAKMPEDLRTVFGFNNARIVTHMSNFRTVKRIEDVIKVFAKIEKKVNARLLLIGDGPEQRTAYKSASKLGIINKIHFLGLQSSIVKLLSITDIFLLPSEKENFSLSALEAMACGVPVISTNVGGMPEMIENGIDGYLAEVGDIDQMAKYAIEALSNPDEFKKISVNARKKAFENFTSEVIVPKYEELYKRVLGKA